MLHVFVRAVIGSLMLAASACGDDSNKNPTDSGLANIEVCDGKDNDGDGMVDEIPNAAKAKWQPITSGKALARRFFTFKTRNEIYGVDGSTGQVVKWDGAAWSTLTKEDGLGGSKQIGPYVHVDPSGTFYALQRENNATYSRFVKWDGAQWVDVGATGGGAFSSPYFVLKAENNIYGVGTDNHIYKSAWTSLTPALVDDFFSFVSDTEIYGVNDTGTSPDKKLYKFSAGQWALLRDFAAKSFFQFVSADEVYMIGHTDSAVYRVGNADSVQITTGLDGALTFHRVCDAEVYTIDPQGNVCWYHE